MSPKKRGRWPGGVGKQDFELLLRAFKTFKQINQINGESSKNTQKHLIPLVNSVLRRGSLLSDCLFKQLRSATDIDFKVGVEKQQEDCRIR